MELLNELLVSEAKLGNLDGVRSLLRSAPNFNPKGVAIGDTALTLASSYGHADLVRELLKHDEVDVNKKTRLGRTALMLASEKGHVAVVS